MKSKIRERESNIDFPNRKREKKRKNIERNASLTDYIFVFPQTSFISLASLKCQRKTFMDNFHYPLYRWSHDNFVCSRWFIFLLVFFFLKHRRAENKSNHDGQGTYGLVIKINNTLLFQLSWCTFNSTALPFLLKSLVHFTKCHMENTSSSKQIQYFPQLYTFSYTKITFLTITISSLDVRF